MCGGPAPLIAPHRQSEKQLNSEHRTDLSTSLPLQSQSNPTCQPSTLAERHLDLGRRTCCRDYRRGTGQAFVLEVAACLERINIERHESELAPTCTILDVNSEHPEQKLGPRYSLRSYRRLWLGHGELVDIVSTGLSSRWRPGHNSRAKFGSWSKATATGPAQAVGAQAAADVLGRIYVFDITK